MREKKITLKKIKTKLAEVNRQLLLIQSGKILQAIYDSEINYSISSPCWDGGFTVKLGDELNGFLAETNGELCFANAIKWLIGKVFQHFPDSKFTKENKLALDKLL